MVENSTVLLTCDITEQKRLELFEHFCSVLIQYIHVSDAVRFLSDMGDVEELINSDHSPLMDELLEPFMYGGFAPDEEVLQKILRRALPGLIETDIGAKKVTIKW